MNGTLWRFKREVVLRTVQDDSSKWIVVLIEDLPDSKGLLRRVRQHSEQQGDGVVRGKPLRMDKPASQNNRCNWDIAGDYLEVLLTKTSKLCFAFQKVISSHVNKRYMSSYLCSLSSCHTWLAGPSERCCAGGNRERHWRCQVPWKHQRCCCTYFQQVQTAPSYGILQTGGENEILLTSKEIRSGDCRRFKNIYLSPLSSL